MAPIVAALEATPITVGIDRTREDSCSPLATRDEVFQSCLKLIDHRVEPMLEYAPGSQHVRKDYIMDSDQGVYKQRSNMYSQLYGFEESVVLL
jgi:hypothetical protein